MSVKLELRIECSKCSENLAKDPVELVSSFGGNLHDDGIAMQCPVCGYLIHVFFKEEELP